jgi:hypothetical protein
LMVFGLGYALSLSLGVEPADKPAFRRKLIVFDASI